MTEEINEPQAQTQEIEAPQEQEQAEQVQNETPQAEAQDTQASDVEASTDNQEPVTSDTVDDKPKPIIEGLTYTSKEELVKGVKAKDEYIEKLKADLQAKQQAEQEVYKQLGYQNELQFKNAQVEQQLTTQYNNDVAMVENAYNTDLITLNNALDSGTLSEYDYQNKIAELQQLKVDYLAGVKANDMTRRQQAAYQAQQAQAQAIEQQKNSLYEAHKEHKDLIDLFYDPQPTIEKAIAMKQKIAEQAVEAYKASLQAGQENSDAKANLNSSVNVGNPVQADSSMPQSIKAVLAKAEKDPNWYNSNNAKIQQLIAEGVIK
jgi:hypothetical protein